MVRADAAATTNAYALILLCNMPRSDLPDTYIPMSLLKATGPRQVQIYQENHLCYVTS